MEETKEAEGITHIFSHPFTLCFEWSCICHLFPSVGLTLPGVFLLLRRLKLKPPSAADQFFSIQYSIQSVQVAIMVQVCHLLSVVGSGGMYIHSNTVFKYNFDILVFHLVVPVSGTLYYSTSSQKEILTVLFHFLFHLFNSFNYYCSTFYIIKSAMLIGSMQNI